MKKSVLNHAYVRDHVRRMLNTAVTSLRYTATDERMYQLRRLRRSQIARRKPDTNGQPIGKNMWLYR